MDQTMYIVSSLEKVFSDTRPLPYTGKFSMLRKDRLSFQAWHFSPNPSAMSQPMFPAGAP